MGQKCASFGGNADGKHKKPDLDERLTGNKQIFPGLRQNTLSPESGCYSYAIGILNFSKAKWKCRNLIC